MTVRAAGGQGFYGDSVTSVPTLLDAGVDYLCLEALAELTLAILQKDRLRDPGAGFTRDLPLYLELAMPYVARGQTKVITNAGGINPVAAGQEAAKTAAQLGLGGLRIATVTGDDLMPQLDQLAALPGGLANADTGEPWRDFPGPALFANAYLGARPIVAALADGADIVITGRVADASLFLAPLIHEYGWAADDWDLLAAGTAIGHLCECSGQSTGGNLSGDWWTIAQPWNLAYPIAECEPDGTAVITKPPGTGGRVDFDTVRHQLLYEVHDPAAYLTPDVTADFTTLRLDDLGADRVRVSGARGRRATGTYKALACHPAGWSGEARVAFSWPDAYAKARATEVILRKRAELAGLAVGEWLAEYWGVNALHGPVAPAVPTDDIPEVLLRMAWRCADAETAGRVGRELVPLALSAPPWGMTGAGRGMTGRPSQLLGLWPALVRKDLVDGQVHHDITSV
ncbi:MAG TPA: acyclic terpene utilization AtuA family protein [Streptosporangiaceae bacterium]|nr:acyclic terpene utilization AtuA family protein [Streptosporangiaceae bacterium]